MSRKIGLVLASRSTGRRIGKLETVGGLGGKRIGGEGVGVGFNQENENKDEKQAQLGEMNKKKQKKDEEIGRENKL